MGKSIGKFVSLTLFVLFFAFLSVAILTACGEDPSRFLMLKDAYESGLLTKEDLQLIAERYNCDESEIGEDVLKAMKRDYAALVNQDEDFDHDMKYSAKEIELLLYRGEYHGIYIVQMKPMNVDYAQVVSSIEIDGIIIEYTGPFPMAYQYEG